MGLIVAFYLKANPPHYVTPFGVPVCFFRFSRDSAAKAAPSPGYFISPYGALILAGIRPQNISYKEISISLIAPYSAAKCCAAAKLPPLAAVVMKNGSTPGLRNVITASKA